MDMIKHFFDMFLSTSEWSFTVKIVLCMLAGFIIGKERQSKGKNAWISTFTLVITGSMLFTFLSESIDPASTSRIAAQIVTWIWFLWAWLIFNDWSNVKNLTTAAGIWFAWAIWMAIWFEYYGIAVIATAVAAMAPRTSDTLIIRRKKNHWKKDIDDEEIIDEWSIVS